jgi:hypothetical protein
MAAAKRQQVMRAKRQFWARHLQRWEQSGLSQAEYCRRHQISGPAFAWWKRRSAPTREAPPATVPRETCRKHGSFVELTRADGGDPVPTGGVVYEIVLPRQQCLRLGPGFELDRVRQLLDLLERSC